MGESIGDPSTERDLSKDTKLKKLCRDVTDWMFTRQKPISRYDQPWYYPKRWHDWKWSQDPFIEPPEPYRLEKEMNYRYTKPLLNLPIADMLAQPLTRQFQKCADLELKCLECLEYYGAHRGTVLCQDYYDDWKECSAGNLSELRVRAMQLQHHKKYWEYVRGEREYDTVYAPMPSPQGFDEPLRTHKNDFSEGFN